MLPTTYVKKQRRSQGSSEGRVKQIGSKDGSRGGKNGGEWYSQERWSFSDSPWAAVRSDDEGLEGGAAEHLRGALVLVHEVDSAAMGGGGSDLANFTEYKDKGNVEGVSSRNIPARL